MSPAYASDASYSTSGSGGATSEYSGSSTRVKRNNLNKNVHATNRKKKSYAVKNHGVKVKLLTNTEKKARRARAPRARLMKWTPEVWTQVLLHVTAACGERGIDIPWETVGQGLGEDITASAVQQALLKLRNSRYNDGLPVPPPLKMNWSRKLQGGGPGSFKSSRQSFDLKIAEEDITDEMDLEFTEDPPYPLCDSPLAEEYVSESTQSAIVTFSGNFSDLEHQAVVSDGLAEENVPAEDGHDGAMVPAYSYGANFPHGAQFPMNHEAGEVGAMAPAPSYDAKFPVNPDMSALEYQGFGTVDDSAAVYTTAGSHALMLLGPQPYPLTAGSGHPDDPAFTHAGNAFGSSMGEYDVAGMPYLAGATSFSDSFSSSQLSGQSSQFMDTMNPMDLDTSYSITDLESQLEMSIQDQNVLGSSQGRTDPSA